MSKYYNPKRKYGVYDPESSEPFKVSRSKIDLFLECPRCFYFDLRLGTKRPPGYPFTLNAAVDKLLKQEFDVHRKEETAHPLMEEYGVDAVPFQHEKVNEWRNWKKGLRCIYKPTNFLVYGAIDDVWELGNGKLAIVDYKATSKKGEVSLDADWQIAYKRQVEVYQWLLSHNGFDVSNKAYFVYCNGDADKQAFDRKIEFDIKLIEYEGNSDWIEDTLKDMHKCLNKDEAPEADSDCDFCAYRKQLKKSGY